METFGLTALEAMTYGLPVIVPPAGGIAEITPDGKVGFHLDGRATAAVAEKLGALSRRPDYYAAMSRAARLHAQRFTEARLQREALAAVRGEESRKEKMFQDVEQVL